MLLEAYAQAIEELSWRFQRGDSVMGLKGQNIAAGGGGAVFDEEAADRLHGRHLELGHQHDVRRVMTIDATLAACADVAPTLRRAFEPFGRASAALAVAFTPPGMKVCLLALAVTTEAAFGAYARAHGKEEPAPVAIDVLLRWMERETRSLSRSLLELQRMKNGGPSLHCFTRIQEEAAQILATALVPYEEIRSERARKESEIRREDRVRTAAARDVAREQSSQARFAAKHPEMAANLAAIRDLLAARATEVPS